MYFYRSPTMVTLIIFFTRVGVGGGSDDDCRRLVRLAGPGLRVRGGESPPTSSISSVEVSAIVVSETTSKEKII